MHNLFHNIIAIIVLTTSLIIHAQDRQVNYDELTIVNRSQNSSTGLSRTDMSRYDSVPDLVKEYAGYSSGLAIAFTTDSPYVRATWTTTDTKRYANMTDLMQRGLDLYILQDSAWIHAGVAFPDEQNTHEATLVDNMKPGEKDCLLYLPLWCNVEDLKIIVNKNATIKPCDTHFKRRILFVGSSITHGVGASRPGLTFPARLQRLTDSECVNLGFSGQCRLDMFYADLIANCQADLIVLDPFSNSTALQIEERLQPFIDRIRSRGQEAPIILLQTEVREIGNFDTQWHEREQSKRATATREVKRLLDSGYKNLQFLDPGLYIGCDHDNTIDGTHPTDAGHSLITNHLLHYIQEIVTK